MLRVLAKMGVEKIFASPGSEWSPVWEALAEPGVKGMHGIERRHEEVAVGIGKRLRESTGQSPAVAIITPLSAALTMGSVPGA